MDRWGWLVMSPPQLTVKVCWVRKARRAENSLSLYIYIYIGSPRWYSLKLHISSLELCHQHPQRHSRKRDRQRSHKYVWWYCAWCKLIRAILHLPNVGVLSSFNRSIHHNSPCNRLLATRVPLSSLQGLSQRLVGRFARIEKLLILWIDLPENG